MIGLFLKTIENSIMEKLKYNYEEKMEGII